MTQGADHRRREHFERSDAEILRQVEEAGGWGPFMREQQRRSEEAVARIEAAGRNFLHVAVWDGGDPESDATER
jgi:hypothetical protein